MLSSHSENYFSLIFFRNLNLRNLITFFKDEPVAVFINIQTRENSETIQVTENLPQDMKANTYKNKNWGEGQDSKTGFLSCLIPDCGLGEAVPFFSHLICSGASQ